MIKVNRTLVLIMSSMLSSVWGQIAILQDDLPKIGTINQVELDTSGVDVSGLTTSDGENQNWTFTETLNNIGEYSYSYIDPASIPSGNPFPEATQVTKTYIERVQIPKIAYILDNPVDTLVQPMQFEKVTGDTVKGLGMELNLALITGIFQYKNPSTVFPLPLQYGNKWTEFVQVDTVLSDTSIAIGDVPLSVRDTSEVEINGWGTLTIGTESYECLRLRYNWSRGILVSIFGLPMTKILGWQRIIYRWITKDLGVILEVVSQEKETNPQFTNGWQVTRFKSSNVVVGIQCDPDLCQEESFLPIPCELYQNHPNPFNPTTQIVYSLAQPARVDLAIFSVLGQKITQLESGMKNRGNHRFIWDGKDHHGHSLPSGIYIYRLKAMPLSNGKPFIQTKKMIMAD